MNRTIQSIRMAGLAALVAGAAGCGGLFDVESPGLIADADLNTAAAVPGLVAGMSNRMSRAIGRAGDGNSMVIFSALLSGELFHGGSYSWDNIPGGFVTPEDGYMGGAWNAAQEARWVAEAGLRRMASDSVLGADFASNAYVSRAYLFAALANRTLGENFCSAVVDSVRADSTDVPSGAMSSQVYFDRAMGQADSAIAIGGAAGSSAANYVKAAYGVRASLKAWAGDWAGAVADAQQVTPATFVYNAAMQQPDPQNELWDESFNRREYTAWSTFMSSDSMAQLENMDGPAWQAAHLNDPRAKWKILAQKGQDGYTLMYQEQKYTAANTPIPLVKGTEMLLLQAEAALRQATPDTALAYQLMNQARAVYTLPALTTAPDVATAWKDLHYERGATLWLEGRHLWDASRWYNEAGPSHSEAMADRDQCLPISLGEINANPNLGSYKASLVHPLKHQ